MSKTGAMREDFQLLNSFLTLLRFSGLLSAVWLVFALPPNAEQGGLS
jgi:hypothetical protein